MRDLKTAERTYRDLRSTSTDLTADGEQPNLTRGLVRTPEQRAADLLEHLVAGYYEYTYATCLRCHHSEIAHNAHGCEARTDDGRDCECRR